jgi:hypothetical protein
MIYEIIIAYSLLICSWTFCIYRKSDQNPSILEYTYGDRTVTYVRLPDANFNI